MVRIWCSHCQASRSIPDWGTEILQAISTSLIPGPAGAIGPQGPSGARGPPGLKGDRGDLCPRLSGFHPDYVENLVSDCLLNQLLGCNTQACTLVDAQPWDWRKSWEQKRRPPLIGQTSKEDGPRSNNMPCSAGSRRHCGNLWNDRMISICFQSKSFNITVFQVYALTNNAEEAGIE